MYFIGIAPGYKVSTLWIACDAKIIAACFLDNVKLFAQLPSTIDQLLLTAHITRYDIDGISILIGPAPLTTTRTVCAWVQGWLRSNRNLKVILLSGMRTILSSFDHTIEPAILILQAYAGNIYWFDNRKQQEIRYTIVETNNLLSKLSAGTKIFISYGLAKLDLPENLIVSTVYAYDPDALARESYNLLQNNHVVHDPSLIQPYTIN